MNWRVEIDYKRGPSIGMTVPAETEAAAIQQVKEFARASGWTDAVKKVKAYEVTGEVKA